MLGKLSFRMGEDGGTADLEGMGYKQLGFDPCFVRRYVGQGRTEGDNPNSNVDGGLKSAEGLFLLRRRNRVNQIVEISSQKAR